MYLYTMKKEWFASWFDSPFYHILYKNRNDEEAENFIRNLLDFLKLAPHSKVLDLACGKGRHARMLHQKQLNVTGLDLSPNSIYSAKAYETKGLSFDVHDMREIYKVDEYKAVFNLFTSFGYFEDEKDNLKMLTSVHEMLNKEGLLVIDFMNATKVISSLVRKEEKQVDHVNFSIRRNYDGQYIFKHITFFDGQKKQTHTERVQAFQFDDFKRMLHESNFKILRTFGNFDLDAYNELTSDRLIIIAQKNS